MKRRRSTKDERREAREELQRRAEERIRALEPRRGAIAPVSMLEPEPELPYVPYYHEMTMEQREEHDRRMAEARRMGEREQEEERKRREAIGEICGVIVGRDAECKMQSAE